MSDDKEQQPRILPWVAWYGPDGRSYLSMWVGDTRRVILAPIEDRLHWYPAMWKSIPDDVDVYEVPETMPGPKAFEVANKLNGILVVVFAHMKLGNKSVG